MMAETDAAPEAEEGEEPPASGGLRAELRPYLPDRATLRVLGAGSAVLVGKGWAWVTADGRREVPVRLGYVAGGGYLAAHMASTPAAGPYVPFVASAGAVGWCVAAWLHAPADDDPDREEDWDDEDEDTPGDTAEDPREDAPEEQPADTRTILLAHLDEATRGRNGVHLAELHHRLAPHPPFAHLPRSALAPFLEAHGVPVQRTLSVDGVEGRSGVRRSVVEALLASPTPGPADGPSQPAESGVDLRKSRPLSDDSRTVLGPVPVDSRAVPAAAERG